MSLKDRIAADVADVFLDEDDFAEQITYTPAGGSPRTIVAVVYDVGSRRGDEAHHLTNVRRCKVFVRKDATVGVDTPRLGDSIVRPSDVDPTLAWDFKEVVESDAAAFTLLFEATVLKHAGQINPSQL